MGGGADRWAPLHRQGDLTVTQLAPPQVSRQTSRRGGARLHGGSCPKSPQLTEVCASRVPPRLTSQQLLCGETSFLNSRAKENLKQSLKQTGKEVFLSPLLGAVGTPGTGALWTSALPPIALRVSAPQPGCVFFIGFCIGFLSI